MSLDLEKIKKELQTLPSYDEQISLQGTKDNLDPFWGIGKFDEKYKIGMKEIDFNIPLFDIPYINSIIKDLKMYRTRIMKLKSKTCYSYHKDLSKRIHIPIQTNENCFIIIDKKIEHLPADGNYHVVDTTQYHTALNASFLDRIHLVGIILTETVYK
jgi:hypothetical protein